MHMLLLNRKIWYCSFLPATTYTTKQSLFSNENIRQSRGNIIAAKYQWRKILPPQKCSGGLATKNSPPKHFRAAVVVESERTTSTAVVVESERTTATELEQRTAGAGGRMAAAIE